MGLHAGFEVAKKGLETSSRTAVSPRSGPGARRVLVSPGAPFPRPTPPPLVLSGHAASLTPY